MKFDSEKHTNAALANQINDLRSAHPELRIAGSLGRSVLFGFYLHDHNVEFGLRGQHPLQKYGEARDIDTIGTVGEVEQGSFRVDNRAFNNRHLAILRESGRWALISETRNYHSLLDDEVMHSIIGEGALGIEIPTVPLATHVALTLARPQMRRKDSSIQYSLLKLLKDNPPYNPDIYEPFAQLGAIKPKVTMTIILDKIVASVPERIMSHIPHNKMPHPHL